nr:hypothetical protein B0A51_08729 [Rachicladosporium sp. CCFEE 5018]
MCTQFEYQCYFEKHPRKRSKLVEADAVENGISPTKAAPRPTPPREERPSLEDMSKVRSMEANSGLVFTKQLGMRLDASAGPKLFTFGWNLANGSKTEPIERPVTDYLTLDQILGAAKTYFRSIHKMYGMVEQDWFLDEVRLRYSSQAAVQCPDHLMANVASLGILFGPSGLESILPGLIESARLALESTSTMQPPTIWDVQSFTLRTIYLRATGHPHACWLASSVAMHLIESCGLHQELSNSALYLPRGNEAKIDPCTQRRTFWLTRMLNTWVSFEYGRTRVALRGITCQLPLYRDGDWTREYLDLYGISISLDPECTSDKPGQWEDFLSQLERYESAHECIELSRTNLGFAAYRRIRLANPNVPNNIINRIINLGLAGLKAATSLAHEGFPWWHVGNIPFLCICIFLAMDTRESLSQISTAMRTLELVASRFDTKAMKEALKTARFLVRLSKRKKEEDSDILGQSLRKDIVDSEPLSETERKVPKPTATHPPAQHPAHPLSQTQTQPQTHRQAEAQPPLPQVPLPDANEWLYNMSVLGPGPQSTSSGEDWNMEYLNNSDYNWNFFLQQDIPAFEGLAPDGMM